MCVAAVSVLFFVVVSGCVRLFVVAGCGVRLCVVCVVLVWLVVCFSCFCCVVTVLCCGVAALLQSCGLYI